MNSGNLNNFLLKNLRRFFAFSGLAVLQCLFFIISVGARDHPTGDYKVSMTAYCPDSSLGTSGNGTTQL